MKILRLVGGRQVRTTVGSPTRAAGMRASLENGDVRSIYRVSLIAAARDDRAGGLDDVAGSEFLDDRIRLRE
jgi:hypothetical protein